MKRQALKRLNIEVRDLPVEVNVVLNALASIRGVKKSEIIRTALIAYASKHAPRVGLRIEEDEE